MEQHTQPIAKYRLEAEGELYRIVASRDIPMHDVLQGDLGGLVSGPHNLAQEGECCVYDDARVSGTAHVHGNAIVYDNAWVSDNARVGDNACVSGSAHLSGSVHVYGTAYVFGKNVVTCDYRWK